MSRPLIITIIAILVFVSGVFLILGAITSFGLGLAGAGIFALLFGIAYIALAIGLWQQKKWAWMAALVLVAAGALYTIIQLFAGWTSLWSAILSLVIDAAIIYILFRPEIRAALNK